MDDRGRSDPLTGSGNRRAFLEFNWAGTSLEKAYKESNQVKFVPISYKNDWAVIREIDERFRKVTQEKP